MKAAIYWNMRDTHRFGLMARPRGGEWLAAEVASLRAQGVDVLVSLLTTAETAELGLDGEASACAKVGICFRSFPIDDRAVPDDARAFTGLVRALTNDLRAGRSVVIHCRAGMGRSALVAAAVMAAFDVPLPDAMRQIAAVRGCTVPDTDEQYRWLETMERELP